MGKFSGFPSSCLPKISIFLKKMISCSNHLMASFMSTVSAPATPRSSAVTGSPALEEATTILPSRSRMSARSVVRARMAMISLATVMSNLDRKMREAKGETRACGANKNVSTYEIHCYD